VWIAVRHNLRAVLEEVTVADLAAGRLPGDVERLADEPEGAELERVLRSARGS
jgi:hypothetical protein